MRLRAQALLVLVVLVAGWALPARAKSDEEKIEEVIAAVIDAYSRGDYAAIGRYYAPEATIVPVDYRPPIVGWGKVAARYQSVQGQLTGAQMTRENTLIKKRGKVAWAVYEWRFVAVVGDRPVVNEGHTTLIFEKRGGHWLIVHNHTSAVPAPPAPQTPEKAAPQKPAPPQ